MERRLETAGDGRSDRNIAGVLSEIRLVPGVSEWSLSGNVCVCLGEAGG